MNVPYSTPVICGPTAGGKSDLAVALALHAREQWNCPAEVITADAFQVYRGLDIGTAKPTEDDRRGVPHHLIDIVDPCASAAPFTVDDWLSLARATASDIRARGGGEAGGLPIVVGGTHLYIKALLDGLFDGPEPDEDLRAQLTAMDPALRRAELERVDPAAAARIHPNDIRRTVRALEVFRLTGTPISAHQKQWDQPTQPAQAPAREFQLIILDWDSESLNRRINARVKHMFDRGLLDEVRALRESGALVPGSQPAEALGYKQLLAHLADPARLSLDDTIEKIKIETRRFGKNQRTWLRRLRITSGAITITMPATDPAAALTQIVRALDGQPKE